MAINIYSGNSGASNRKANSAQNSTRAQKARAMLSAPSEVSDSGSTAVKTGGTLAKVGNTIGKVAGIASKFLPGVAGSVATGIANLLNDPEWWQSVPGDALTLNAPLRDVPLGDITPIEGAHAGFQGAVRAIARRIAIGEINSLSDLDQPYVILPTAQAVTQYLMPQVRKVVNAIPLQTAEAYNTCLRVNATIYALWRNFKKYDYLLKHGQTYLANMNDVYFPILQVENASYLQAAINRLEEYLRANVRLPHTLCEYLAWRFGRVYKSNDSAKAALIMYNVLNLPTAIANYETLIATLMSTISSSHELQQANTDLYNAYYDHDMTVDIPDSTQFTYDMKEFMLRTNCKTLRANGTSSVTDTANNLVVIDSRLDNPTAFMASTVSTPGTADDGTTSWLFPVETIFGYFPRPDTPYQLQSGGVAVREKVIETKPTGQTNNLIQLIYGSAVGSNWCRAALYTCASTQDDRSYFWTSLLVSKSLDIYNKGIYLMVTDDSNIVKAGVDITSLSIDAGVIEDRVLGVEHIYAFANLVDMGRKASMSYQKAEKLVARDTANLIEKLDVSTVAATPVTK